MPANKLLFFFPSISQSNFFIFSLPPAQTRRALQMQKTNRRCKEEFLHFNITIKISFGKRAFVSQLSCPMKSRFEKSFEKSLHLLMALQTKGQKLT